MIEGSLIQWLNQVLVSKSKKANYIIYSNTSYNDLTFSKPFVLARDLEPIQLLNLKQVHSHKI